MNLLPMPLRVAAGLVAVTVERARQLPRHVAELPVTAVSQALQISMRVQQRVTDLAIKGDRALDLLRPTNENPSWARFDDEEEAAGQPPEAASANGARTSPRPTAGAEAPAESVPADPQPPTAAADADPADVPGYDELSIAQLRARLRRLSVEQLERLLAWELVHQNRPAFVTMLGNRITTVTGP